MLIVREERAGAGAGAEPLPLETDIRHCQGGGRPSQPGLPARPGEEDPAEGRGDQAGGQQDHPRQEETPAQPGSPPTQTESAPGGSRRYRRYKTHPIIYLTTSESAWHSDFGGFW